MITTPAIKSGNRIYTGSKHNEIGLPGERGFVTDTGQFLSRTEAAKHAFACGQLKTPKYMLYSEDIDFNDSHMAIENTHAPPPKKKNIKSTR
ncbi:MAG: hypothetical protein JW863_06395 [Chitinispirillaceae bacterium]|nr:hypothetical protein [Chitinispirillaceae bacterium]